MKEVSIEITHDCALKCVFCSSSADHPPLISDMPLDVIKSTIDDAIACGANVVSVSGGEPLLHKNIFQVFEYCKKKKLSILLYTSGVLFENESTRVAVSSTIWKRLRELFGDKITVVFDFQSYDAKNVEYLNDIDGSYEMIIDSIKRAVAENLACEIHLVPMKQNYREIPKTLEFCKSMGIKKVSFLRFVPQGRGAENAEKLELSASEFFELQKILLNSLDKHGKDFIRLGHPIDFLFCVNSGCEITACRGGDDAPLILPNGDVHMCPAWKDLKHLKAGNVIDDNGLKFIWENSTLYIKFREFISNFELIDGLCKKCILLDRCKGGCTAQRILLFDRLSISFPDVMYLSPDPVCPLLYNFSLISKFQHK